MAQAVNSSGSIIVSGAAFDRNNGGKIINNTNQNSIFSSNISAAATISNQSLSNLSSLNMLIIDNPIIYETIDNSTHEKSYASSVIVVTARRQDGSVASDGINVSLYFKVLSEHQPNVNATYYCSFYDTINSRWNESGCTQPQYDNITNRYQCSCNHLTSFALLWSPSATSYSNVTTFESPTTELTTITTAASTITNVATATTTNVAITSGSISSASTAISTSSTTSTTTTTTPVRCNISQVTLSNGTCIASSAAQV